MAYKIYVYAICKNEESFVERWMHAAGEADGVIVVDTGSSDETVQRLRAAGATVYEETIAPWRFDTARNRAMDFIPLDVDICVSVDLDEVFEAGWRARLESAWNDMCTRAKYTFVWSHHADGTPQKTFFMEKIHARQGFRWAHPVHEVLEYSGDRADKTVWVEGLVLHHYPDAGKTRGQYLPLLELSAQENPQDDRTIFWLGREYTFHGKYERAIETLEQHLRLPSAKWDEERSASMRYIAQSYLSLGRQVEAKRWLLRAVAECPETREPYLGLARLGYAAQDWPLCYAMTKAGLAITRHSGSYLVEPECWGAALYDLGAIAAYRLGLYGEAKTLAVRACALEPLDKRLKQNLEMVEEMVSVQTGGKGERHA